MQLSSKGSNWDEIDFEFLGHPLESSRMRNRWEYHFLKISQWGYIRVYGMLMIGQQGVVLSKLTGVKLLSLLLTETLRPMLVLWLPGSRLALARHLQEGIRRGYPRSWIIQSRRGWDGRKRITWSIITAQSPKGFHKGFHQSVNWHRECSDFMLILLCI